MRESLSVIRLYQISAICLTERKPNLLTIEAIVHVSFEASKLCRSLRCRKCNIRQGAWFNCRGEGTKRNEALLVRAALGKQSS